MTEFARPPLTDQSWFAEFLGTRGFQRSAPDRFSNGRATLRVEGSVVHAIPGDGSRAWRTDVGEASPEIVRQLLTTVLAASMFQSQAELDLRAAGQQRAEAALQVLTGSVREHPETHSGVQLRRFLWSLFNQHHVVNLWQLKSTLDRHHGDAVNEVFTAWMEGLVSENALRHALTESGEMARWDKVRLDSEDLAALRQVGTVVNCLLRNRPPGEPTLRLARLDTLLDEAAVELRRLEQKRTPTTRE